MIDTMTEAEVRAACKELAKDVERKRIRIAELEAVVHELYGYHESMTNDEIDYLLAKALKDKT